MTGLWLKRFGLAVLGLALAAGFYLALREKPVDVDSATVSRGPMQLTLMQEGETRVREIYTISTPIAGHLSRTVLKVGDPVVAHRTVVAAIHPLDPPLIDNRTYEELLAGREVAAAAVTIATAEEERASTALQTAKDNLARSLRLARSGIVPESSLERSAGEVKELTAALASARSAVALRSAELKSAEARLRRPGEKGAQGECCVNLTAPADGVVLAMHARSEQPVAAGARIADIGDPRALEIVAALTSADAVSVRPGTAARIVDWGGAPLRAHVTRVEPAAFTKVSALGIEEQRVNVVLDLDDRDARLGNAYRVFAELVLWESNSALQVPVSALFRKDGQWSLYRIRDGRAETVALTLGHINGRQAEVLSGLVEGDRVILFPSDVIAEGRLVAPREGPAP